MPTLRRISIILLPAGFFIGIFLWSSSAHAAVVCWDGGGAGDTNWNTATNWEADTAPGSSDVATFDSTDPACSGGSPNNNATINVDPNVAGINITNYTGTITQSAGIAVTIGASGYSQSAAGSTFTASNATITINSGGGVNITNGILTHADNSTADTNKLVMSVNGDFTLGASGQINADGMGWGGNETAAPGDPGSWTNDGGGHGGIGGDGGANGVASSTYGSITAPISSGSGGGRGSGGAGGGVITITVSGLTTINGTISAKGVGANEVAGAGGSVYLTTGTIAGSGSISVNGGTAFTAGGAGGRAAVILTGGGADFASFSAVTAYGGDGNNPGVSGQGAAAGTVYLQDGDDAAGDGELIIDNNSFTDVAAGITTHISTAVSDTAVGDVTIQNGAKLEIKDSAVTLTVSGNWTNSATQTLTNGTVTFDATTNKTINSNSQAFYNFTKTTSSATTLTFIAGTATTVSGTLTLQGAAGNLLSLRSSSVGTQWSISPQGTVAVSYLDVQDSNNTSGTAINCTNNCQNSGNNISWVFPGVPPAQDTTSPSPVANLTTTPQGNGSILLTWTSPTESDFTQVRIYRSTLEGFNPTSAAEIAQVPGTPGSSGSYSDATTTDQTIYYYIVISEDANGNLQSGLFLPRVSAQAVGSTDRDDDTHQDDEQDEDRNNGDGQPLPLVDLNGNPLQAGDTVRGPDGVKVYVINEYGYKRHIFNPKVFNFYYFDWGNIKPVSQSVLDAYPTSALYRVSRDSDVFFLEEIDESRGIAVAHFLNMSSDEFEAWGYNFEQVFSVILREHDSYLRGADFISLD